MHNKGIRDKKISIRLKAEIQKNIYIKISTLGMGQSKPQ